MRRLTLVAALVALCGCTPPRTSIGVDGDFDSGVDVGPDACRVDLDDDQLRFEEGPTELLGLSNPCEFTQQVRITLDDPAAAFAVSVDGQPVAEVLELAPDGFVELEVALIAQDTGTYEGQLIVSGSTVGPTQLRATQLFGVVTAD